MNDTVLAVGAVLFFSGAVCLIAGFAWKAFTPRGFACYVLMWCCAAFTGVCDYHSTWPSSAPRRQAEGVITWIVDHPHGKSAPTYTLGLALPSGAILPLQASAMPPFFAKGHDLVSVTYLDESVKGSYARAIGFHVLTGPRAGYNDAVDANWLGLWLGVVIGPLCGCVALWKALDNKRPKVGGQIPVGNDKQEN